MNHSWPVFFLSGIGQLVEDKLTEFPDTINVLARMNVYQEMVLATIYRAMPSVLKVSLLYIYINYIYNFAGVTSVAVTGSLNLLCCIF